MINKAHGLSIRLQCQLLDLHRSRIYYKPILKSDDTLLANELAELYRQYPMYGYRRLRAMLYRQGHQVNGKRVLRLMRELGLRAIYPAPRTTILDKKAYKHPNLLKDLIVTQPHQVWQIDITYLRTDHGFMYLNALIDIYSRVIVGWFLSNTLEAYACLISLERAIAIYGLPEMIHSDQGSQFTSLEWICALQAKGILISMSGCGRSNDGAHIERLWRTLKYEAVYLQGVRTVPELKKMLKEFVVWYNQHRPHQALRYKTPSEVLKASVMNSGESVNKEDFTHILTELTTVNKMEKDSLSL
jgi:putative transposase